MGVGDWCCSEEVAGECMWRIRAPVAGELLPMARLGGSSAPCVVLFEFVRRLSSGVYWCDDIGDCIIII